MVTRLQTEPVEAHRSRLVCHFLRSTANPEVPSRSATAMPFTRAVPATNSSSDPARSRTPRAEIDSLFQGIGNFNNRELLKYELSELKTIASGPPSPKKRWLQRYLKQCEDSPEKRILNNRTNKIARSTWCRHPYRLSASARSN